MIKVEVKDITISVWKVRPGLHNLQHLMMFHIYCVVQLNSYTATIKSILTGNINAWSGELLCWWLQSAAENIKTAEWIRILGWIMAFLGLWSVVWQVGLSMLFIMLKRKRGIHIITSTKFISQHLWCYKGVLVPMAWVTCTASFSVMSLLIPSDNAIM